MDSSLEDRTVQQVFKAQGLQATKGGSPALRGHLCRLSHTARLPPCCSPTPGNHWSAYSLPGPLPPFGVPCPGPLALQPSPNINYHTMRQQNLHMSKSFSHLHQHCWFPGPKTTLISQLKTALSPISVATQACPSARGHSRGADL